MPAPETATERQWDLILLGRLVHERPATIEGWAAVVQLDNGDWKLATNGCCPYHAIGQIWHNLTQPEASALSCQGSDS